MKRFTLWSLARFAPDGDAGNPPPAGGNPPPAGGGGNPPPAGGGNPPPAGPTGLEWMTSLPDDLRADETLKRFTAKDANEALGKISASYLSAKRMVSEGSLPMPKTDEDRARIFEAMGRPKTEGDYSHKLDPKALKSGITPNAEASKGWNALAHKIGLSDAQHGAVSDFYWQSMDAFAGGMIAARDQEFRDGEAALKAEWKGPLYEQNTKIAQAAIAKFGGQALVDFFDETGMGNHPLLVKAFQAAGAATMSDEELKGAHHETGGMTKDQIDRRKAEIKAHPAYMDGRHPQHKALVTEMEQLMQFLHPEAER